ncbi:MAG: hypothetical protein R3F37_10690 [Candidatus Competibacteraceae bacterium]
MCTAARPARRAAAELKIGSPSGVSYDDTGAVPGITYYYRVKACNGAIYAPAPMTPASRNKLSSVPGTPQQNHRYRRHLYGQGRGELERRDRGRRLRSLSLHDQFDGQLQVDEDRLAHGVGYDTGVVPGIIHYTG